MSDAAAHLVLSYFAVFSRFAGCLMLMPGFSSQRVAMRIRLWITIAVTLALGPLVYPLVASATGGGEVASVVRLIIGETLVGIVFGLSGRLILAAVEMAGTAIASLIGFGGLPGAPIDGTEPVPALSALISVTATMLFFVSGLHLLVLEAQVDTYRTIPPGTGLMVATMLSVVTDQLGNTLQLTGKMVAPFIIYAVVINLAVGLTNKLSPQIPVFFVSLPFVVAGGLFLLVFAADDLMAVYRAAFAEWLING